MPVQSFLQAVNRVLLRWIKMWDHVVFNKPKPVIQKNKAGSAKEKGGPGKKLNYKEFMKMKYEDLGLDEEFDTQYRPQQKVG